MRRHAKAFKTKEIKQRNYWHLELQQKFPGRISKDKKRDANKYACRKTKGN